VAQCYAEAGVLRRVAGLEDFADTDCKICPASSTGSKVPPALFGLCAFALGSESRISESRAFYETQALRSGWSIRQLDRQIGAQFYERIALSKNKAATLEKADTAVVGDIVTGEAEIGHMIEGAL
jgi:hypothetical protein